MIKSAEYILNSCGKVINCPFFSIPACKYGCPENEIFFIFFPVILFLFIMGSLCRYHPEIWGPFVLNDETGERLLFEKFIYYSRRIIIPNIVACAFSNTLISSFIGDFAIGNISLYISKFSFAKR